VLDSDEIKNWFFHLNCCHVNSNVCSKNMMHFIISSIFCVILKDILCPIFKVVALWRYFLCFLKFGLSCYIEVGKE